MNYLDLFSGIGGFALGAYWAGFKCENHYYSEIEKYPAELYQLRFPDSIPLGDITKIDFESLKDGNEWIITGGFPCQDISIAGKGAGIEGKRSGLWFEYWRAIRILRPRFAIIENVGAITIRGLDRVLSSLAEIGYDAEWQDIRAADVGAPHRRERIWIIAYPSSLRRDEGACKKNSKEWKTIKHEKSCNYSKKRSGRSYVAYPSSNRQSRERKGAEIKKGLQSRSEQTGKLEGRPERRSIEISNTSIKRLQRQEPERQRSEQPGLSTECNWWSTESRVDKLANGVPGRVDKLKGLGNSIVPQIAELLFRQIKPYL